MTILSISGRQLLRGRIYAASVYTSRFFHSGRVLLGPKFKAIVDATRDQVEHVDVQEAHRLQSEEKWNLVDVREDREWAREYAHGATHIGRGVLDRDIQDHFSEWDPILLYCAGGVRSVMAAKTLVDMGYENVRSVNGGFSAWKEAGMPIVPGSFPK
eukprot:Clim_evm5s204 gene=Clim_evmTU5s204